MNAKTAFGIFAATVALAAAGDSRIDPEIERYLRFSEDWIFDVAGVSDEQVHQIVAEGIASENRHVVDLTLRALNQLSLGRDPSVRRAMVGGATVTRPLARVRGLKRFLIDHWRAHLGGSDYELPLDVPRPDWWPVTDMQTPQGEEPSSEELDELWQGLLQVRQWEYIPRILAGHWPRDPEVLEVIWEDHDYLGSTSATRDLLDMGEFDTEAANAFRAAHPPAGRLGTRRLEELGPRK